MPPKNAAGQDPQQRGAEAKGSETQGISCGTAGGVGSMKRGRTLLPQHPASWKLQTASGRGSLSNFEQVQQGGSLNTANTQNRVWSSRVTALPPSLSPLNEL